MNGTTFLSLIISSGMLIGVLFRSLALSSLSYRLTQHTIWSLDHGIRYGWLIFGAAAAVVFGARAVSLGEIAQLTAVWLIGLAAIWFIPPRLAQLF